MSGRVFVFRWAVVAAVVFGAFAVPGPAAEPPDSEARLLHVLLSGDPQAPTPEQVVEAVEEGRESPLQGLRAVAPERAGYAWPGRAQGDAARWLRENPDTTRAILERYIVLTYAHEVDLERVIDTLRSDPWIAAAYVPAEGRLSSAELTGFGVPFDPFGTTGTQYGRAALNIDAAWALASGYALVGVPDTGLKENHAALRQFAANGDYLGGNFIPESSTDIGIVQSYSGWRPNVVPDYVVDEMEPEPMPKGPCDPDEDGYGVYPNGGHGTHVSGLLAARGGRDDAVRAGNMQALWYRNVANRRLSVLPRGDYFWNQPYRNARCYCDTGCTRRASHQHELWLRRLGVQLLWDCDVAEPQWKPVPMPRTPVC
jgi:hypothetical protein